jgi:glycosyl hydrolase family 28
MQALNSKWRQTPLVMNTRSGLRLLCALAMLGGLVASTVPAQAVGTGLWYTAMPAGTAIVAPAPTGAGSIPLNGDFSVTVAGKNSPVYTAKAAITYNYQWPGPAAKTEPVGFTNFDITGAVTATITVRNRTVTSAKVVPANYKVTPTVNGNVITVRITHPGKYEVQINGSEHKVLYLFANPVDPNPPKPGDPGVSYYGPGIHNIGRKTVGSNQTVYIAAGAIVHGELTTNGSNVKIRGRGILDCSGFATHDGNPVLVYSSNTLIEGITINDSPGWSISLWGGSNQIVDNIKLFAHRQNTDGIDVVSNTHTEIKNVFLRNWDDGIAIKAMHGRDVYDINVRDSIISTDFGWGALEIGAETPTANISNIRFSNIDILHDHAYNAIDIQNSDQANVHDVTYSNIRITNHHGYSADGYNGRWISMEVERNQWSSGPSAGRITNITLNNVHSGPASN